MHNVYPALDQRTHATLFLDEKFVKETTLAQRCVNIGPTHVWRKN